MSQLSRTEIYIVNEKAYVRVHPDSVEQFIGEFDRNKQMVFEGDLLRDLEGDIWLVRFSSKYKGFVLKQFKGSFVTEIKDVDFNELVKIGISRRG